MSVIKKDREAIKNQESKVIWLTGLSGSGKSTIANHLEKELNNLGKHTYLLDGDNVRKGLCSDLGFSDKDRNENIRRIAEVANLFSDAGLIVITAFISPFISDRAIARKIIGAGFVEVYCDCSLEECIRRDTKGLYARALAGEIKQFTGISSPYEKPVDNELNVDTCKYTVAECVTEIIQLFK
jgi:adenylylsulfate kinase